MWGGVGASPRFGRWLLRLENYQRKLGQAHASDRHGGFLSALDYFVFLTSLFAVKEEEKKRVQF